MLRASAAAERAGVPTVTIVATQFLQQAAAFAQGLGLPNLSVAHYPGVPMTDSADALLRKTLDEIVPQVVRGLAEMRDVPQARDAGEPADLRATVFRGTHAQVQAHFLQREWSDGLPVVPPTVDEVDAFLRFCDAPPEHVIGILPPDNREATVWNVAVNGVMAGCRPEYMPILLAIADIIQDPAFRLEDAGSTPGWEPIVIVNGPLARQLDFNAGAGAMRIGRQANASIGRFLRLYIRNVAGSRIAPTGSDKGCLASNFFVALAENEAAVAAAGWQPFSVDQGFAAGENVVTVQSVVAVSAPIYTAGDGAQSHMEVIAEAAGDAMRYWCFSGFNQGRWFPLLVLGPAIASAIAASGWNKDDVRRFLHERLRIRASTAERYAWHVGLTAFSIAEQVQLGILPPHYAQSADPDREVPMLIRPEWLGIVVAGDPGRNQSKLLVNNHVHGARTSRAVRLPARWDALLAQAAPSGAATAVPGPHAPSGEAP